MNLITCIKQINDPEIPPGNFKIDPITNKVVAPLNVPPVISTFDEYALEAALRIREQVGGKVTALSLGINFQRDVIKKSLSMGADDLILLEDPAFTDGDSWSTAYALSLAIKKIGSYDLILCGRQSADLDSGQVGSGIAEMLGLPCVTLVRKVEIVDKKARLETVTPDGYEVVEMTLPGVITLGNEHPAPRYPNVKGILMAKRKDPIIWKPADIGAEPSKIGFNGRRLKTLQLFKPVQNTHCDIITGETPEEAASRLAYKLREIKAL